MRHPVSIPRVLRSMLAIVLLALAAASPARAAFTCSASTGGVSFGAYDPLAGTVTTGSGTVTVVCTLINPPSVTVNYTVALSAGLSGTYASRTMQNGTQTLNYNLYTDAAHTMIWGDGSGGTSQVSGSFRLRNNNPSGSRVINVYGSIPASQDVGIGTYGDSITVTVTF